MKSIKTIAILVVIFCSLNTTAQTITDGDYFTTNYQIEKVTILNRKNGTIKATLFRNGQATELVFTPNKKEVTSYDVKENRGNSWILKKDNEVVCLLELDSYRAKMSMTYLANNKKELKEIKKKFGIKGQLNQELGSLFGKKEEEVKTIVVPEYFVENPTSDFHQKNAGKIVFFSKKPTVGQEDLTTVKTAFKVGDEIWAVAYLPVNFEANSYMEILANKFQDMYGKMHYSITIGMDKIDDDLLPDEKIIVNQCTVRTLTQKDLELNYVVFPLTLSSTLNKTEKDGISFLYKRMGERLEAYKHELRISLTDGSMKPEKEIFSGVITYDAAGGTESLLASSKEIEEGLLKQKRLPTAVMHDANLEAEMLQQIRLFAHAKGWEATFTKAIITLNWQILKDDYGNIKGNYVEGDIVYKSEEGCGYRNFGFLREYLGGGQYDSAIRQYTTGHRSEVSCDKVK